MKTTRTARACGARWDPGVSPRWASAPSSAPASSWSPAPPRRSTRDRACCISFVLAAICSGFSALCYAEFATLIPVSGSSYSYAYATLGEVVAWFIGWNMVLEYGISASAVATSWTGYFSSLMRDVFGVHLPAYLTNAPLAFTDGHLVATGALFNLPAVAIVLALTWLCYVGIRESSGLNALMVLFKVGLIVAIIVAGARYVEPANWHPFIPAQQGRRHLRLVRHLPRRRGGVLRLHRLRGHLHGGAGMQEPAARPALRHHPVAVPVHACCTWAWRPS